MNNLNTVGVETRELQVDLRQTIYALSNALDLVGIDEVRHGKRVGYMAMQCAAKLELEVLDANDAFEIGLLHDCGVSSSRVHRALVEQHDWPDSQVHCQIGYKLLKDFPPLAHMALPILYHHTYWNELSSLDLPAKTKLFANLIHLVDRVDAFSAGHLGNGILLNVRHAREFIEAGRGICFSPVLVDAFMDASSTQAFWLTMEERHLMNYITDLDKHYQSHHTLISLDELEQLARLFSRIIDAKSQFTVAHSIGVAHLSCYLAKLCGLSKENSKKIEAAALLHDIGKLHVPDEILEKPGPLNAQERAIIEQHSFETYEILRRISGIEDIAKWAAFHHETVSGNGYPFRAHIEELDIEARIIAVADIFQALAQDRPYREGLALKEILRIMNALVEKGNLDESLVALVNENALACYHEATRTDI
ncbi:metal dependent phosphohydrolase [Chloroherpeton thalassium ATCC 35110]|uniref:Metal dependent phosphohydrolase n=1 Tax=Chloroherpeton thalassium (strain ATCC 35110 / GB-78) TaxID=517418 RepID=B3QRW2_CHLT3|nr:HD domain-containing phosphohydrolase [Chloroherpeton thalassium]ACF13915.1 metal dependent phosphohydrolase [Chloroherpeton thalassium ATCC 35110]